MNKSLLLKKVAEEIEKCAECKIGVIGKSVPGEGNSDAEIIFVGEAPGKQEAATGKPFIGRSGQLLTKLLDSVGIKREEVFITSVGKYLPEQGTPTPAQTKHGAIHLQKQIAIINPKIIVLLGKVAALGVLNKNVSVLKDHGTMEKVENQEYLITIHPAAALRFPPLKEILEEDFRKLNKLLG